MKRTKRFAIEIMVIAIAIILSGCNYKLIDTTYKFDKAIVLLPDDSVVSGKIDSWTDYEGDQLQIEIDGTTYLVHASNAAMIAE